MVLTNETNRVHIICNEHNVNEVWFKDPVDGNWIHQKHGTFATQAELQSVINYVIALGYQVFDTSVTPYSSAPSEETFKGYCFPRGLDGWHTPAVTLRSPEEVFRYTQLHGKNGFNERIVIEDEDGYLVVEMIDGKYTHPQEWLVINE